MSRRWWLACALAALLPCVALAGTNGTIKLAWDPETGVDGFFLYWGTTPRQSSSRVANSGRGRAFARKMRHMPEIPLQLAKALPERFRWLVKGGQLRFAQLVRLALAIAFQLVLD